MAITGHWKALNAVPYLCEKGSFKASLSSHFVTKLISRMLSAGRRGQGDGTLFVKVPGNAVPDRHIFWQSLETGILGIKTETEVT